MAFKKKQPAKNDNNSKANGANGFEQTRDAICKSIHNSIVHANTLTRKTDSKEYGKKYLLACHFI